MVSLPSRFKKGSRSASPNSSLRNLTLSEQPTLSTASVSTVTDGTFVEHEKDWEIIEDDYPARSSEVELEVHPLPDPRGVIVSVKSPESPPASFGDKRRYPVDIVLIIDVSSSMESRVRVPKPQPQRESDAQSESLNSPEQESYHTRLDLAKNAVRGVVAGLDERDRVGIVTFGYEAAVFHELTRMNKEAQELLLAKIDTIEAKGATNLWAGLREGYRMLTSASKRPTTDLPDHSLSAVYLLTDGLPNVLPPPEGYVPALRRLISKEAERGKNPVTPSLHTFGFGYQLRSGLLQSMAEVGGGYYAFIPEASFVATIFNHAFANLNITFSTSAKLTVIVPGCPEVLKPLKGSAINCVEGQSLEISLYNLQYGQRRDIFLTWPKGFDISKSYSPVISAILQYTEPGHVSKQVRVVRKASDTSKSLSPPFAYYHLHRSMICEFLSSVSRANSADEYMPIQISELEETLLRLETMVKLIKASGHEDNLNTSILRDLESGLAQAHPDIDDPAGQIHKALSKANWFEKWGAHYLPSILHAYRHQLCLNEKDPGPKAFIAANALFAHFKNLQSDAWDTIEIRLAKLLLENAERDEAFANSYAANNNNSGGGSSNDDNADLLSGHAPSYAASRGMPDARRLPRVSMAVYNNPDNPCFAAPSRVLLASGAAVPVYRLRAGARVRTPVGARRVVAVLRTAAAARVALCRVGALLVTPWHPVLDAKTGMWVFPAQVADVRVWKGVDVYSVLLEEGGRPEAHAVCVGGRWCVTLGHGVVARSGADVRGHEFFGDYNKVVKEIMKLPKERGGLLKCGGMKRDEKTGLACGFKGPFGKGDKRCAGTRKAAMML